MTEQRYDRMMVVLHWLLALGLIGQLGLGLWMEGIPKDPPGERAAWFNLHKSIGMVLGLFILWRMGWRVTHSVPADLPDTPGWQQTAAKLNHGLMYVFMLALPLSGFLGSSFSQYPVKFFGMPLPRLWEPVPEVKSVLSEVHEFTAFALLALLALHLLAVCWHVAVRRDGLLQRMTWRKSDT
jgi:cytochrome b561